MPTALVKIGQLCLVLGLIVNQAAMVRASEAAEGTAKSDLNARARAETLFAQGLLSWADADTEAAKELFLAAAGTWPHDETYAFFAGYVALRRNRAGRAVSLFARALPPAWSRIEEWRVHYELGRARYLDGDLPEAEARLRRALDLNPEDSGALFCLGFVMLERQQPAEAVPLFEAGRDNAPQLTADSHFYTGVAALRLGDVERAGSEFQKVIAAGARRVRNSIPEIMVSTREYLVLLESPGQGKTGAEPTIPPTSNEGDRH